MDLKTERRWSGGCYDRKEAIQSIYYLQILYTVRVMLITGLRNVALTKLKVKDVSFEEQVIHYDAGIFNSKNKIQIFPTPSKLLSLLKEHLKSNQLQQPEDTLLVGLKGYPLRAKQFNRITDKICD
ncbi:tyrosine-type recombinase/integrase [Bacillus sp. FJAT-49705]|uniref:Tyrosine-type recombinase/integrase n=1 Tax=Cytobacillus citreus TaxID=2833586 RepID=A0ABS5NPW9_9BACI|nr:tyrosine-type recombinase/integrase [Cytobacillus citreus]MBS4189458.1 tyrosine-type recombinase/integrase [Cytobacillus citreus]